MTNLDIYEAARKYLSALQESEDMTEKARLANIARDDREIEILNLLNGRFKNQAVYLYLESGETLNCHYDYEEGFTHLTLAKSLVEVSDGK